MFTLNGGHIWPLYEAARNQGVRLVDTRHEQSAAFAAEAYAKLTRRPGVAALTAGPGITNGVSAVTSAWFNGSPLVVLGGRAPQAPLGRRVAAGARPRADPAVDHQAGGDRHRPGQGRRDGARGDRPWPPTPHRGPVFLDFPLDVFGPSAGDVPARRPGARCGASRPIPTPSPASPSWWPGPSGRRSSSAATCTGRVRGPELAAAVEHLRVPVFTNGLGRGTLPADHELAFLRTRGPAQAARRRRRRARHAARLPPRLRPLRLGDGRPRRRRRSRSAPPTSTC